MQNGTKLNEVNRHPAPLQQWPGGRACSGTNARSPVSLSSKSQRSWLEVEELKLLFTITKALLLSLICVRQLLGHNSPKLSHAIFILGLLILYSVHFYIRVTKEVRHLIWLHTKKVAPSNSSYRVYL